MDGHGSHITIEFIEFCLSVNIVAYCLPAHSTHLLQPLDVGLFSPLQKAYGKQVDRLVRFGNVAIHKGNFLPMLVEARTATYTQKNILSAWRGAGLIPHNPRHVLDKLTHGPAPPKTLAPDPPLEPPTPRNTAELHRQVRQATLRLRSKNAELNRAELASLIERLERFALAADKDRELERRTLQQWQEVQRLAVKVDKREIGRSRGKIMDGKALKELYIEREVREAKKQEKQQKATKRAAKPPASNPPHTPKRAGKQKAVSFVTLDSSDNEESGSGEELDN